MIVGHQSVSEFGVDLRPEDVIVSSHSLNWGKGNSNPMDDVKFYKSENNLGKFNERSLIRAFRNL